MHSIGNGYGENDQVVVDSTGKIAKYAVHKISKLSNDTIDTIDTAAFKYHLSVDEVDCKSLTSIGDAAFAGCCISSIKHLQNVSNVGKYAFAYGHGPTIVDLPLSSMPTDAFYSNTGI
jgi:hypothetical protein